MSKKLVILGAGESGIGTAMLAKQHGWEIWLSDFGKIKPKYAEELNQLEIPFEQEGHTLSKILEATVVVKSPGISNQSPIVKEIAQKGIPIISEMEFAQPYSKAKVIAITGTNGKTTTTSLIHHLLVSNQFDAVVAGNIGISYAKQIALRDPAYFVLELSSFQLDDCYTFKVDIAVLLNITPDHLDRYNYKISEYAASKFKITQNQTSKDHFIFLENDELINQYMPIAIPAKKHPFQLQNKQNVAAFLQNNYIQITQNNFKIDMRNSTIKGIHNTYNTMAAGIVGSLLELKNEQIQQSFASFKSIEHRLEFVAKNKGVSYINDSKATNVNSAWYALESVNTPIIWIAGGVDKGNEYKELKQLVKNKVRLIICLGLDNIKIHRAFMNDVDMIVNTQSAKEAVYVANRLAKNGETVLLSPACASFDLFEDYEHRGRMFKQAVQGL